MVNAEDLKEKVKDIQTHFNCHINNKYVKNLLLRVDIPIGTSQRKDFLLKGDLYFVDSKGALEDLCLGAYASLEYIDIIRKDVVPRLAMTNGEFIPTNPNERVLCQMTLRNYKTNVDMFEQKIVDFYKLLVEYDNNIFPKEPAYTRVHDFDKLKALCEK